MKHPQCGSVILERSLYTKLRALQRIFPPKNPSLLWKWVGGSRSHSDFFLRFGKSSQNCSKPVLIFWSSIQCAFCLYIYALLKVVNYYDLSVLSMSVMGFQKKSLMVLSSSQVYLGFFNFANPLPESSYCIAFSESLSFNNLTSLPSLPNLIMICHIKCVFFYNRMNLIRKCMEFCLISIIFLRNHKDAQQQIQEQ